MSTDASELTAAAQMLESAIYSGNLEAATEQVKLLCEQCAQLDIRLDSSWMLHADEADGDAAGSSSSCFALPVIVESRQVSRAARIHLKASASTSIGQLRSRVACVHRVPADAQCWIVAGQVVSNDRRLGDLGLTSEATPAHLYLLSRPGRLPAADDDEGRKDADAADVENGAEEMQVAASVARAEAAAESVVEDGAGPDSSLDPSVTWECPSCTYENAWHRPGCEMCTQERPGGRPISAADAVNSSDDEGGRRFGSVSSDDPVVHILRRRRAASSALAAPTVGGKDDPRCRRIVYSRDALLALRDSPLARRVPSGLPPELMTSQPIRQQPRFPMRPGPRLAYGRSAPQPAKRRVRQGPGAAPSAALTTAQIQGNTNRWDLSRQHGATARQDSSAESSS